MSLPLPTVLAKILLVIKGKIAIVCVSSNTWNVMTPPRFTKGMKSTYKTRDINLVILCIFSRRACKRGLQALSIEPDLMGSKARKRGRCIYNPVTNEYAFNLKGDACRRRPSTNMTRLCLCKPKLRPAIESPLEKFDWSSYQSINHSAYAAPALFEVTDLESTGTHIGPFSFTMGETPVNSLLSSGFEPMSFRFRYIAEQDSDHRVFADTSEYDTYINGLYDGGLARVMRMVAGEFVEVRRSRIERFSSSGWHNEFIRSSELLDPLSTEAQIRLAGWYAPSKYWVKIVAVTADGQESNASTASFDWVNVNDGSAEVYTLSNTVLPQELQSSRHAGDRFSTIIPSPQNLQISQDLASGLIRFSWDFPIQDTSSIVGFRLYRSSWPSEEQEGFSILLAPSDSNESTPILKGDMVFLDHTVRSWSRKNFTSARVHGTPEVSCSEISD